LVGRPRDNREVDRQLLAVLLANAVGTNLPASCVEDLLGFLGVKTIDLLGRGVVAEGDFHQRAGGDLV
jgi:hypothetical protein